MLLPDVLILRERQFQLTVRVYVESHSFPLTMDPNTGISDLMGPQGPLGEDKSQEEEKTIHENHFSIKGLKISKQSFIY